MSAIETPNEFMIGLHGENVVVMMPPKRMTHDQSLLFAAWLVVMSDGEGTHSFEEFLQAVKST